MNDSAPAYISLGSNLGDRRQFLFSAVERLHAYAAIHVERCSSVYETAPVGYMEQPYFLNMAIAVRTSLEPLKLLRLMLETERELGRVRGIRFGPRTIDLDLLLYGREKMKTEELELPHPRMRERAFVLVPLMDIMHPDEITDGEDIRLAYEAVEGKGEVELWQKTTWRSEFGRFES